MSSLHENLSQVAIRIEQAAKRSGRIASAVQLIGVTKGVPVERIREAVEAGLKVFGENYVQEAIGKSEVVGTGVIWHMIGHLQRNKAKDAAHVFRVIQTIDSPRLAETLDKHAEAAHMVMRVLVQVNISSEESKSGIDPDNVLALVEDITTKRKNIQFGGLMTIAPFFEDPELARPYFGALRELGSLVQRAGLHVGSEPLDLSMGMSGDFEVAIEEGATMVRIGTAIFGTRTYTR